MEGFQLAVPFSDVKRVNLLMDIQFRFMFEAANPSLLCGVCGGGRLCRLQGWCCIIHPSYSGRINFQTLLKVGGSQRRLQIPQ